MTEKQLERGQALSQEIKYLDNTIHKWENLTEIISITIRYQYIYIILCKRLKREQFLIILMFQSFRKRYYPI